MAKRIIVEHRNRGCISGCLGFCVAIVVIAILVAVLSYVGCIAAGVGLWFLVRYIWRSLVRERPDSGIVRWGLKRAPIARKVMAGAACALVSIILIAAVSSGYANSSNRQDNQNANQASQEQQQPASDGDPGSDANATADDSSAEQGLPSDYTALKMRDDVTDAFVRDYDSVAAVPLTGFEDGNHRGKVYAKTYGYEATQGGYRLEILDTSSNEVSVTISGTDDNGKGSSGMRDVFHDVAKAVNPDLTDEAIYQYFDTEVANPGEGVINGVEVDFSHESDLSYGHDYGYIRVTEI